jgi:hypothetical protein
MIFNLHYQKFHLNGVDDSWLLGCLELEFIEALTRREFSIEMKIDVYNGYPEFEFSVDTYLE